MLFLIISFLAGILTILAPCILPTLPLVIGGSIDGKKMNLKKSVIIISSLSLSVILFTLLIKFSTIFISLPDYFWRILSGTILLIFGFITIFPSIWGGKFINKLNLKSNLILGKAENKKSFIGDVIIGFSLGPVFSTCSPTYFIILATILPVSFVLGLAYLMAYVLGLSISLMLVAVLGRILISKIGFMVNPEGVFKRIVGIIFILIAFMMLFGLDKKLQGYLLDIGLFDVTRVEQSLLDSLK